MNKLTLPYREAKPIIEEADVLLFKGTALFSWAIRKLTKSPYSHVELASKHNGGIEGIGFNALSGGGSKNLARMVQKGSGVIDVYRPVFMFDTLKYNPLTKQGEVVEHNLDARGITSTMRQLAGMPYGVKRIWWILKNNMLFRRWFINEKKLANDQTGDIVYPVCSTAVAYCFSKNNYDLIKNKADEWTVPGHIAMSPLLSYMFTLVWDEEDERLLKAGKL